MRAIHEPSPINKLQLHLRITQSYFQQCASFICQSQTGVGIGQRFGFGIAILANPEKCRLILLLEKATVSSKNYFYAQYNCRELQVPTLNVDFQGKRRRTKQSRQIRSNLWVLGVETWMWTRSEDTQPRSSAFTNVANLLSK